MKIKKTTLMYGCIFILIILLIFIGFLLSRVDINGINTTIIKYTGIRDAILLIVSAISLITILLLYYQIKTDHEKARREKTVDVLLEWTKNINKETHGAKKIVELFDKEQCRKLYKGEIIKVSCQVYQEFRELCNKGLECEKCEKNKTIECTGMIELSIGDVKRLRWLIVSYLNILESILVAWQYSIVDRDIIEQQFAFLVDPKADKNCLQEFRIATGSEASYPAIEIFCNHLENERKKKLKEKGKIA